MNGQTLEKESGRLVPLWFEGKQVPQDLYIEENYENDQDDNDDEHGFKGACDSDDDMDYCDSESDSE